MRGWLHTYAFFVAAAAGVVLTAIAATRPGVGPAVSTAIYSLTVCGLFGISALYHRRVWSERGYRTMRRLDHPMIFIFIAGTYTPCCVLPRPSSSAALPLVIVRSGALACAVVAMVWP